MSVYSKSKPDEFLVAVESIVRQTIPPNEIILIIDGPISEGMEQAVDQVKTANPTFKIIRLPKNQGLGNALKIGVENASYDLIARMDSDDISLPNRFELQLQYHKEHPETDIFGGQITEFIDDPHHVIGKRVVPLDHESIRRYMKRRCAMNHPTVMFRKEAVIRSGNYQHWFQNEDYYLWIRMLDHHCKFGNLDQVLVNIRAGSDLYARRGGKAYFKSEVGIQRQMRKFRQISIFREIYNITIRFFAQILIPNQVRAWLYQTLLRKENA